MTRLSSFNNSKKRYLEFNVGKYFGLISKSGRIILKPEFQNALSNPSKYNDNAYFVVHKSGYGGVLDYDEKLYLPKERAMWDSKKEQVGSEY